MIGILIKYKKNGEDTLLKSYIEDSNYENALRKFLRVKGGKKKIEIQSIQDWDRSNNTFTIDKPITIGDEESVVYKIMNE